MQTGARNARTGHGKSFIEVLEAELRAQIRAELLNEFTVNEGIQASSSAAAANAVNVTPTAQQERLELWLLSHLSKPVQDPTQTISHPGMKAYSQHTQKCQQKRSAQQKPLVAPQTKAIHPLDVEDLAALEFLRRQGAKLGDDYDAHELKTTYRTLALRMHPDRHTDASEPERQAWAERFAHLHEAVKRLSRHFTVNGGT